MSKVGNTRRVLDDDEFKTLEIHRQLWKRLNTGEKQLVVTEDVVDLEDIFGRYLPLFNLYMNKGLLEVITIDELPADQHQFTVIK